MQFFGFGGGGLRPPPELLHHTGKAAVVHLSSHKITPLTLSLHHLLY
jgi:hypothetical protein